MTTYWSQYTHAEILDIYGIDVIRDRAVIDDEIDEGDLDYESDSLDQEDEYRIYEQDMDSLGLSNSDFL
jgi:hypothetical protein